MIIISDTSVVSNLIQIGHIHLLKELFGTIIIPAIVRHEILQLEDYGMNLEEFRNAHWINIQDPVDTNMEMGLLASLDAGESAAITLAKEMNADYLAIDERAGRRVAKSLGIKVIGLVGILVLGKEAKIIENVRPLLDQLIAEANFYIGEKFYQQIIENLNE